MRGFYLILLTATLAAAPAPGLIINGDFETGDLTGWTTVGDVLIDDGTLGPDPSLTLDTPPDAGNYQLMLTTLPNPAGSPAPFGPAGPFSGNDAVAAAALEAALGLRTGVLDRVSPSGNPAVEGSAAYQDVTLAAGDWITVEWNLLTNEPVPTQNYTDFAFFSLTPKAIRRGVQVLGDTNSSAFATSGTSFRSETGTTSTSFQARSSGTFRLGVGVTDVLDDDYASALVVLRIRKSPEPETFALVGTGLIALGIGGRSRRRRLEAR